MEKRYKDKKASIILIMGFSLFFLSPFFVVIGLELMSQIILLVMLITILIGYRLGGVPNTDPAIEKYRKEKARREKRNVKRRRNKKIK